MNYTFLKTKSRRHLQIVGARRMTRNQLHARGPRNLEWHVDLAVTWGFLLNACELIRILIGMGKNCNCYTENITCYHSKFNPPGKLAPRIVHLCISYLVSKTVRYFSPMLYDQNRKCRFKHWIIFLLKTDLQNNQIFSPFRITFIQTILFHLLYLDLP